MRSLILRAALLPLLAMPIPASAADHPILRPSEVWREIAGQPIHAQGRGMLYHDGTYYRYDEDKEGRTWLPESTRSWEGYRRSPLARPCGKGTGGHRPYLETQWPSTTRP